MIDIHTHILPQVDDGCNSLEEAREMLKIEIENGVDQVICTPHFCLGSNKQDIMDRFEKLKDAVKDLPVTLYLGAEILWLEGTLKALKNDELITLNQTKTVLIEFDFIDYGYDYEDILYDFVCAGYQVILAHPERYMYMDIPYLKKIYDMGVYLQVNVSSIAGDFGKEAKKRAKALYKKGLIDFIASDAHHSTIRIPNLTEKYLKYINHREKPKIM